MKEHYGRVFETPVPSRKYLFNHESRKAFVQDATTTELPLTGMSKFDTGTGGTQASMTGEPAVYFPLTALKGFVQNPPAPLSHS